MKQYWNKLALRLDALNLRERVLVFGGAAFALVILLHVFLLEPQFNRQKKVSQQLKQDQTETSKIQLEIQSKWQAHGLDPDKMNQEKLKQLRQQTAQLRSELMGVQKNLVSPEKMPLLLEDILKRNGKLRLISLKNLPLVNLNKAESKETEGAATKLAANAGSASDSGSIYRHGVEIVVQGNYMDMMNYLAALEKMPWELYWGRVKFQVDPYPTGTLTLTVYTLSLDKSWLNI
jgi:MSHA biogenesis protein MshJ